MVVALGVLLACSGSAHTAALAYGGPAPTVDAAGQAAAAADVRPPDITASGAVLWDADDARVLYGRDAERARPMASTTKLMTVLLAVEADTVGDTVVVSPTAAAVGGATLHLVAGQEVPMASLIAGLLLESGNDAAVAVAEHVAGSEADFVTRMNARAAALGLDDTRFVDPHGLNADPDHHASPLDLARLAAAAMAHDILAEYAGMPAATVVGLPPLTNRNELLSAYPWATGVKTGYTALAGMSLVASAHREGRTLYAVVLDSDDRFGEAQALLEHGFQAFRRVEPVAADEPAVCYRFADAAVPAVLAEPLAATTSVAAEATWRTRLRPSAPRPLAAGEPLGTVELHVDGQLAHQADLVAAEAVGAPARGPAPARAGAAVQDALRAFARLAELDRDAARAPAVGDCRWGGPDVHSRPGEPRSPE